VERFAYEPFGKRRFVSGATDPNGTIKGVTTDRGFTNHEHLDALGLIHMNGRVYDPVTGRFISADPTDLQIGADPTDLQAYNRYAYTSNNPLGSVDMNGFEWLGMCTAPEGGFIPCAQLDELKAHLASDTMDASGHDITPIVEIIGEKPIKNAFDNPIPSSQSPSPSPSPNPPSSGRTAPDGNKQDCWSDKKIGAISGAVSGAIAGGWAMKGVAGGQGAIVGAILGGIGGRRWAMKAPTMNLPRLICTETSINS
jgi:RHS repeat-associated protein